MRNEALFKDKQRKGDMPYWQIYYRKSQCARFYVFRKLYRVLFQIFRKFNHIDLTPETKIGYGLYVNHPYGIVINPLAVLGKNINLTKGVTIGRENRGGRKGTPTIGDCVWIGANATIVGKIQIGEDVLIAPNTYVNCDIPSHSIVFGNPCVVKHMENATEGYINNRI